MSHRMSPEEQQRSVDRLSQPHAWRMNPPQEAPPTTNAAAPLSREEMDRHITHLYTESLALREQQREQIRNRVLQDEAGQSTLTTKPLTSEDEEAMVHRLYEESLAKRSAKAAELEQREQALYTSKKVERKLTKKECDGVSDRLYREGMERERDKRIKLFEQYVISRRPPAVKRSPAALAESADKMTKGESLLD